jgi:hypothetical protein
MARSCVFCGGRPLTREHVMPRWLTSVLPEQAAFRGQDQQIVLPPEGGKPSPLILPHREMREPFNALTVKAVCTSCNSGWMNGMEDTARPVLSPLIQGESRELEADDVLALASWTVKTALMAQLTGVEGIAAMASIYHGFYLDRNLLKTLPAPSPAQAPGRLPRHRRQGEAPAPRGRCDRRPPPGRYRRRP